MISMKIDITAEIEAVGENMKQLEIYAKKCEEKLKDKIYHLMERPVKNAVQWNITKMN